MKKLAFVCTLLWIAGTVYAAEPKEDVQSAAKMLAEKGEHCFPHAGSDRRRRVVVEIESAHAKGLGSVGRRAAISLRGPQGMCQGSGGLAAAPLTRRRVPLQ